MYDLIIEKKNEFVNENYELNQYIPIENVSPQLINNILNYGNFMIKR